MCGAQTHSPHRTIDLPYSLFIGIAVATVILFANFFDFRSLRFRKASTKRDTYMILLFHAAVVLGIGAAFLEARYFGQ